MSTLCLQQVRVELALQLILDEISLDLKDGEITGLIGPPDSGKSVLLKILAGLLPHHSGVVQYETQTLEDERSRRAYRSLVGMSFQNDALFDGMNVFDNVAFPLRQQEVVHADIEMRVLDILQEVGLLEARHKWPAELSGGMKKRVGIARAVASEPRIGLFDDPIAGLDPIYGARILELIATLTVKTSMCSVVVSNDLEVLLPYCQKVCMLENGRLVFFGTVSDLHKSEIKSLRDFILR